MDYFICSLEFEMDKNLLHRKYMYKVYFRADLGEKLVAPVGPHNKLQIGVVKELFVLEEEKLYRVLPAYSESSSKDGARLKYPLSAMKSVVCKYSFRKAAITDCVNARDLGGVLYDGKHLTAYGGFVRADIPRKPPSDYNFAAVFYFSDEILPLGDNARRFPVLYRPYEGGRERLSSEIPFLKKLFAGGGDGEKGSAFPSAEGTPEEKVFRAYDEKALMQGVFRAISCVDGTVMLCDKYGAYSVDIIVTVLYLLAGVSPESVYKDYSLSDLCINEKYVDGDKFGDNDYVPEFTEREYISLVKKFIKKYGSAEEYLVSLGLTEKEIATVVRKMTVYTDF